MTTIGRLKQLEDELKKKLAEVQTKKRALAQKQAARENKLKRQHDNRKKYILGGWILKHMDDNPQFKDYVFNQINKEVNRPADRKTLGLTPLQTQPTTQNHI